MPTLFLGLAVVVLLRGCDASRAARHLGNHRPRRRPTRRRAARRHRRPDERRHRDVFRETTSGADGTYFASQLVPGRYRIVAKLPGFQTLERRGLVLQLGTTLTINLPLEVGPHEETVTVTTPRL